MKKQIIFTFLLIMAAVAGFSQLELKPAIGFNSTRFDSNPVMASNSDSLVSDSKFGYQFGASLAIGRKLYVEPGVFYTRLVQDFTPWSADSSEFTYSANYIRIPVNFGFNFIGSTTSFAGLRIYLGPSVFIPVSVKDNDYTLAKEDVSSPQFDISVGAGLNIWLLFLDVSYGWGLTPQFKDDPIEAKMQSFYANLGFRFKLKSDEE
jgi:hypothetical protein